MQNQATPNAKRFAKSLCLNMTDGEQLGVKFRRQHPLGAYVADFACLAPLLIVETDGSQHGSQDGCDARRDEFFKRRGFDVVRFAANSVLLDLPSVVQAIYNRVMHPTAPAPILALLQQGKAQEVSALLLPPLGEGRDGGFPVPKFSI